MGPYSPHCSSWEDLRLLLVLLWSTPGTSEYNKLDVGLRLLPFFHSYLKKKGVSKS